MTAGREQDARETLAAEVEGLRRLILAGDGATVSREAVADLLTRALARAALLPSPPAATGACSTCGGTGLVDWLPGQQRDSEEDQQPCPDCAATCERCAGRGLVAAADVNMHVPCGACDGRGLLPSPPATTGARDLAHLPQRTYEGANRYDTDDEHVLTLWADGQTWDVRWQR